MVAVIATSDRWGRRWSALVSQPTGASMPIAEIASTQIPSTVYGAAGGSAHFRQLTDRRRSEGKDKGKGKRKGSDLSDPRLTTHDSRLTTRRRVDHVPRLRRAFL